MIRRIESGYSEEQVASFVDLSNDPGLDELEGSTDRSNSHVNESVSDSPSRRLRKNSHEDQEKGLARSKTQPSRSKSGKISKGGKRSAKRRSKIADEQIRPPSVWNFYCAVVTFWAPDFILKHTSWPTKAQVEAMTLPP